ncbi:CPBP family intramembrane glutamic endopeptidase [Homoserinibacter sp. YIM 151385]|uniref:CPBP family intramembrane glutamic endopeptidase n=1 Tax=Homoserinibacter sp. YIM 151385 TaxID=2985506 RepID=UPI0022F08796|nr:CPBP family intramembrane glutamic endopeptidase [Homoserinibacter sp. YIM 151385]WBU38113.1 CPBP family intramembrane metalloprotease [Homoserinibacter sp. YIM 151385]
MSGIDGGLPASRRRIGAEILLVLGVSLGASAVYAVVQLADRLSREQSISSQTATLNPSRSDREIFDLLYQLLSVFFDLVPVVLVCWLLWSSARPHLGRLGIDLARPGRDALWGAGLALAIGVPGIVVYLAGRAAGVAVAVDPAGLDEHWWTAPVLLLSAFRAGATEEIIVIGYLFARLGDLRWNSWTIIASTAVLRATYHLYQGVGAFAGNLLMGLLFGWLYSRTKRVLPFVIAHTIIDAAIFIGYPWAAAAFPELFGLPPAS